MSNLIAAIILSFVRIVPDAATNYVASIPVCTNLIIGVGMGPNADYTFPRAEDVEWIAEAATERRFGAGAASRYFPIYDHVRPIPRAETLIDSAVISNMYPLTFAFETNAIQSSYYGNHGFVPDSFAPLSTGEAFRGDGYLCTTSDFTVNGYPVRSDIRALLGPDSHVFETNDLPPQLDFRGPLRLSTITNAYALIADGTLFSTVVFGREKFYDRTDPAHRTTTTNEVSQLNLEAEVKVTTDRYYLDEYGWYSYVSGYTVLSNREHTAHAYIGSTDMSMYSSLSVEMYTIADVKRVTGSTTEGGSVIVQTPYVGKSSRYRSLPHSGTGFYVKTDGLIVSGRVGGDPSGDLLYNTNLAIRAWLVTCWKYSEEMYHVGQIPVRTVGQSGSYTNVTDFSTNIYFVTSLPLGELERRDGFFVSTRHDSGEVAANAAWFIERTTGSQLTNVDIDIPVAWTSEDYPSTVPKNTVIFSGQMTNAREKRIAEVESFLILVITPEWRSKILTD